MSCAPYMPAEAILADWQNKVLHTPNLLPIWLILDDANNIVGHLVAGANVYYTEPFVEICQLQIDAPEYTKRHKEEGMKAFLEWIAFLNQSYKQLNQQMRIKAIRFVTPRSEKAWREWIPLKHVMTEQVLMFELPSSVYEV